MERVLSCGTGSIFEHPATEVQQNISVPSLPSSLVNNHARGPDEKKQRAASFDRSGTDGSEALSHIFVHVATG